MALKDFIQARTNKILIGAGGVGLIFTIVSGLIGPRPALLIETPDHDRTLEISTYGAIGVGSGATPFGTLGDCLKSGGGSGKIMLFGTCGSGAGGNWSNTGSLQTAFDARFVNQSGDSMTGALKVRANLSGSTLNVDNLQNCNTIDTDANGHMTCGSDANTTYTAAQGIGLNSGAFSLNSTISGSLVRFLTVSGSTIFAKNSLLSSGSLAIEGALTGATINGFGLPSGGCSDATNSKLLWNAGTQKFVCGTDQSGGGGTTYFSGKGLGLSVGNSFSLNSTITGALVSFQTVSGSTLFAKNTITSSGSLKILGAMSGNTLFVSKNITTSGSLIIEGALTGATINGFGLPAGGCSVAGTSKLLWNSATQKFVCGTDTDTNTTYTAGQGLGLSAGSAFSLNATITGSLVRFLTVSGSSLFAKATLSSSGSLKVLGNISGSTLNINKTGSFSGAIVAKGNIRGQAGINSVGALSGSTIGADNITPSCLVLNANASRQVSCSAVTYQSTSLAEDNVWVGNGVTVATALPSCSNGTTQALEYNTATNAFSCVAVTGTTYTAGQGLTLTSTSFKISATTTGSMLRWVTISGSTVGAKNMLSSSGGLKVLGRMSGSTLTVNGNTGMSGTLVVKGQVNTKAAYSGAGLNIQGALASYIIGSTRIGDSAAAKAKLDVVGAVSGASLVVNGTTQIVGHTYTWPTTQGTANQALLNNGSDTLSWGTPASSASIYGAAASGAVTFSTTRQITTGRAHTFSTFTQNVSTTLSVLEANVPLVLRATGNVTINGTIDLTGSGGAAGAAGVGANGDGGAGTGGGSLVSGWTTNGGLGGAGSLCGANCGEGGGGGGSMIAAGVAGFATGSSGAGGAGGALPNQGQMALLTSMFGGVMCGGGGGGGEGGSSNGALGGKGGGCMVFYVGGNLTLGSSSALKCGGAAGANGVANNGGGGGGGGGGVILFVVAGSITNSGVTNSCAGGAGGAGAANGGPGGNGGTGAAGKILIYSLSTGTLVSS